MTRIRILLDIVNTANFGPDPESCGMVVYISVQNGKSKTKLYMHVRKRVYSTHAPNFIPTGACLVPLFDCPI